MALSNEAYIVLTASVRQDIAHQGDIGKNLMEMFTVIANSSCSGKNSEVTDNILKNQANSFAIFKDSLCIATLYNIVYTDIKNVSQIVDSTHIKKKYPEGVKLIEQTKGSINNFVELTNKTIIENNIPTVELNDVSTVLTLIKGYKPVKIKETEKESAESDYSAYDAWASMINNKVNQIMVTLEELYTSGYEGTTPAGLLIGQYLLSVRCKEDGSGKFEFYNKQKDITMYGLFNWINKTAGGIFDIKNYHGNMQPSVHNFDLGVGYYPNYQMRNASGLRGLDASMDKYLANTFKDRNRFNNFGELSKYLKIELERLIRKGFKDANIDPDNFDDPKPIKLLNTFAAIIPRAILITDWNEKTAIKLKICCGDEALLSKFSQGAFEMAIKSDEILARHVKVGDMIVRNGVLTVTLMFSESMYYNYPLFAYTSLDAIKRTGKIDWGNVILGMKSDGRIARINLKDNKAAVISMIAGTRSGKGVMTLNLIASAMACEYPILYLDCKPEMSRDLWNLSNRYGNEMFAFDGAPDANIDVDRKCNRFYDTANLPEAFATCMQNWGSGGLTGFARFTCYIRGIEFLNILIRERAAATAQGGNLLDNLGGERLLFVIDELENFFKNWGSLKSHVETQLGIFEEEQVLSGTVKKADQKMNPFRQYWTKYKNWVKSQFAQLNALSTGKMSQANINIFIIAQTVEIDSNWDKELAPLIGGIIKKMSLRICGNGTAGGGGSHAYGTGKLSDNQKGLLSKWYFAVAKRPATTVLEADNVDMVRPYFLLPRLYNEDGSESKALQDLRSGTLDKYPEVAEDITDPNTGKIMPEIAFEGYVQNLLGGQSGNIGAILNQGWSIAEKIIGEKTGQSIVNYMYNLTNFSIFSGEGNMEVKEEDLTLPDEAMGNEGAYRGWMQENDESDTTESEEGKKSVNANLNKTKSEPESSTSNEATEMFGKYGGAVKRVDEEEISRLKHEQEEDRRREEAQQILNRASSFNDSTEPENEDFDEHGEFEDTDSDEDDEDEIITVQQLQDAEVYSGLFSNNESMNMTKINQSLFGNRTPENVVQANLSKPSQNDTQSEPEPNMNTGAYNTQSTAPKPLPIQQQDSDNRNIANKNVINMTDIYRKKGINPQDIPKEAAVVNEVHTNAQAYENGKGKDAQSSFVDSSKINSEKQKMNEENSIYCRPAYYVPITRYEKLLSKSPYGIKHWRKKMFDNLLNDIEYYGNLYPLKSRVSTITLKKGQLFVNSKICNINGSYGGETERELCDYIIFSTLAKKCPMISTLKMDEQFIKAFIMETGLLNPDDYIDKLFKMFPMLTVLELGDMKLNKVDYMKVNEDLKNQRTMETQERKMAEKLQKQKNSIQESMTKERAKDEFDASLKKMVPGYKHNDMKWAVNSVTASKNYWSKTEKALLEEGKKGKALGYGIFTVTALGLAAVTGVGGGIIKLGRQITMRTRK